MSPDILTHAPTLIVALPPRAVTLYYHPCPIPEQMTTLILKHANQNRLGAIEWGPNDFDVCEGDRCIGRIFLSPQSPQGCPWFWTITAREYPPSIHSRGYSATREEAMTDFKAQWLAFGLTVSGVNI